MSDHQRPGEHVPTGPPSGASPGQPSGPPSGPPPGPPVGPSPAPPPGPRPASDASAAAAGPDRYRTWMVAAAVVAVASLVAAVLVLIGGDDSADDGAAVSMTAPVTVESVAPTPESSTTTDPGFQQAEGEIFLEPADQTGPEPFTGEVIAQVTPTTAPPTNAPVETTVSPAPTAVTAFAGDTPALYGGTRNNAECDKAGQLAFLQQEPAKAAAFVEALNGDPSLLWAGGNTLTVEQLPEYFAELTPLTLTRDTRVTNHGYRDGRPTARQVVLQSGTAVLVDAYGVPRARCLCGNPLTAPTPVQVTPVYTGDRWPDFDPQIVVIVEGATIVIQTFVVIDRSTGQEFIRPAGGDASTDTLRQATVWQIDVTATQSAVDYFSTTTVSWSGQFTITGDGVVPGDGVIAGTAPGRWSFDGDCFSANGEVISTDSASGPLTVTLAGQAVTTELGRFLSIQPTPGGFAVDSFSATVAEPVCEQDVYDNAESWVVPAFTGIELQAEGAAVTADYASNGFVGTVTLTPLG